MPPELQQDYGPPSTPDPTKTALWTAQARIFIGIAMGAGLGGTWLPKITDAQISNDITAFVTVVSIAGWAISGAWSWWKEHHTANAAHEDLIVTATASATETMSRGRPVAVIATAPVKP